jgi:cell division protein FtsZ
MTLFEVDEAAMRIRREVDEEANIIFGSSIDDTMNGRVRVSVVATGIDVVTATASAGPRLAVVPPPAAQPVRPAAVAPAPVGAPRRTVNAGMAGMLRQPAAAAAPPAEAVAFVEEAMPQPVAVPPAAAIMVPPLQAHPAEAPPRAGGWRNLFQTATGPDAAQAPGRCGAGSPASPQRANWTSHGRPRAQPDEAGLDIPTFLRRQSN